MGGLTLYVHLFPLILQVSSLASSPKTAIVFLTQIAFKSVSYVFLPGNPWLKKTVASDFMSAFPHKVLNSGPWLPL